MSLIHRRLFAVAYWLVALVATVVAAVAGGKAGGSSAPAFDGGKDASAGSQILFAVGSAVLGGLVVLAAFAGIWLLLWMLERRANPDRHGADDDIEYDDAFDEVDDDGTPTAHGSFRFFDEAQLDDLPATHRRGTEQGDEDAEIRGADEVEIHRR